jgi:hypothetical protein
MRGFVFIQVKFQMRGIRESAQSFLIIFILREGRGGCQSILTLLFKTQKLVIFIFSRMAHLTKNVYKKIMISIKSITEYFYA